MTACESLTSLFFPSIKLWESHFIVILASGTIATATAFFAFRRDRRLRQSEESYRQLVEQSPDAMLVHRRGQIVFANGACAAMFHASCIDELTGIRLLDLVHPDDRAAIQENLGDREDDLSAPSLRTERKYIGVDGREFQVESMVKPVVYNGEASTQVVFRDISERKKTEQELVQSEERFHKAFHVNPEPIIVNTFSEGRYVDVNESFLRVTGYRREEIIGHTAQETNLWKRPEDRARYLEALTENGSVRDLEIIFQTKSGEQRVGLVSAELIDIARQKCAIAVFKDITERNLLERQLRQAQKMEAVGQLSGGIAHDFNNLLGVILGYSDILQTQLEPNSKAYRNAEQIKKAGQRAASLTRQLLAFSRQQVMEPTVLGLNTIVADAEKMLRRLIGEDIELRAVLDPALGRVRADQGQIEQIILNLAVNARDAMPRGGVLTIKTANIVVDDSYVSQHPPMSTGSFIMLSVTDTGVGMNAETQARIFEPFFTTKGPGRGTGLGLATVYGVVKQSGGFIWVRSKPGQGTTFEILLPSVDEPIATVAPGTHLAGSQRGSETVLLVEDEAALRELILEMLRQEGYSVLEAASANEAIEVAQRAPGKIDLLLTDVVMPGMNGSELADQLVSFYPGIRILLMSGYTEFGVPLRNILQQERPLLQKPFTQQSLVRKVREVLESHRPVVHALR
jgi:two-component system, cell cycle sensor histidine kinase and response regulator CckA